MIRSAILLVLVLMVFRGFSQNYNAGYFRNPLGIPMQLVANFGEIRSDHFHMGFDLRTQQQENLPVYASADGYISRIVIEPGGYGRAIYISHPGGYTTLYAHLNDFFPSLQRYVVLKQYNDEQWEQDITFNKSQFPVSKGQFIAYSGNTGSSQGPHLHFEIRDTKTGNNVNPRLFNFPIADNIQPFLYKLFIYDRNYSTYAVAPTEVKIKGSKGSYLTKDSVVITTSPKISFGISAEDMVDGSAFRFGIYSAELWVDSVKQLSFSLDEMNYSDSRYMNASVDYKKRVTDGAIIQHLSKLPGNQLSIFDGVKDGIVYLQDTLLHQIVIVAKDIEGNESLLQFKLKFDTARYEQRFFTQDREPLLPGQANHFERENITIDFPATSFYDTVPFLYAEAISEHIKFPLHQLHYYYVPVHDAYTVSIRYDRPVDTAKAVWKLVSGKNIITTKAKMVNRKLIGSFEQFGMLSLIEDTVPPTLSASGWKSGDLFAINGSISFSVKDDVSYVDHFRAELDSSWLMFSRKGNMFTARLDEGFELGMHTLKVMIKDIAGNETVRSYNFELREKLPVKRKAKKKSIKKKKK